MYDHYQQLLHYIHYHVTHGAHPAHVRHSLVGAGWEENMVDSALHHLGMTPQPLRQPAVQDAPHKYKVFRAIGDTFKSAKANLGNLTLGLLISVAIIVSLQIVITAFMIGTFMTIGSLTGLSAMSIGLIVLIVAAAVIGNGLARAFMTGIIANSVYDGAEGTKLPFGQLCAKTAKGMLRIFRASLLMAAMIVGPFLGAALLMVLVGLTGGRPSPVIPLLVSIGGAIWLIIASLRYILTPYVALFEDDIPVRKALGRSKHLMLKGGQWFLIKGVLTLIAFIFLTAVCTVILFGNHIDADASLINHPAFIIPIALVEVMATGCMTMLYRNRSIVRGQAY